MKNKNILKSIREQKMDRKDFLKYSGVVLLTVVGFKGLMTTLSLSENKFVSVEESTSGGFGSGRYGS